MKIRLLVFITIFLFVLASSNLPNSNEKTNNITTKKKKKKGENYCTITEDCPELNYCLLKQCRHKRFFPITLKEIIGSIVLFVTSALTNASGVGGGGVINPILGFIFKFNAQEGISMSKLIVFIGALTAIINTRNIMNPNIPHKSSVDFNILIITIPLLLFGCSVGVLVNQTFPDIIQYLILSLFYAITFWNSLKIANNLNKSETLNKNMIDNSKEFDVEYLSLKNSNKIDEMTELQSYETANEDENKSFFTTDENENDNNAKNDIIDKDDKDQNNETANSSSINSVSANFSLKSKSEQKSKKPGYFASKKMKNEYIKQDLSSEKINKSEKNYSNDQIIGIEYKEYSVVNKLLISYELEKDRRKFPFYKINFCFISLVILLMITLLKGSKSVNSIVNIQNCSNLYWLIEITYLPISLALTLNIAKLIKEEYNYRSNIGYKFDTSDVIWNNESIIKYSFFGLFTGLVSGMLGIGSGLIMVTFLLKDGINPVVSANTTMFIVVFESFSVLFQFTLMGRINFDYGITLAIISSIGSYVGTNKIYDYIKKTNKQSTLIYIVSGCLCVSFFYFTVTFSKMFNNLIKGEVSFKFNSPC